MGLRSRTLERLQRYLGLHVIRVVHRDLALPGPILDDAGFTFRRLALDEVLALCPDPAWDIEAWMARAAMGRGDACVGAFRDGRLQGYGWYAFADTPLEGDVRVVVPARMAYRYKTFVHASARNRGVGSLVFRRGSELARERGCASAFALVSLHNDASLAASAAAGFTAAGLVVYWRLGPFFIAWHPASVAALGVRLQRVAWAYPHRAFLRM